MKNSKLLTSLVLIFASVIFISCSHDSESKTTKKQSVNEMVKLDLSFYTNTSSLKGSDLPTMTYKEPITVEVSSSETIDGAISVTYNSLDQLVGISISKSVIQNPEIKTKIENKFNSLVADPGPGEGSPHTKCIEYCMEKYTNEDGTKKKGRGRCKFNCWVDTSIRILGEIFPL